MPTVAPYQNEDARTSTSSPRNCQRFRPQNPNGMNIPGAGNVAIKIKDGPDELADQHPKGGHSMTRRTMTIHNVDAPSPPRRQGDIRSNSEKKYLYTSNPTTNKRGMVHPTIQMRKKNVSLQSQLYGFLLWLSNLSSVVKLRERIIPSAAQDRPQQMYFASLEERDNWVIARREKIQKEQRRATACAGFCGLIVGILCWALLLLIEEEFHSWSDEMVHEMGGDSSQG